MKSTEGIGLTEVQQVYSGPEGDLWELIMGEQIHIGGFQSSMDLAERAGIEPKSVGLDLCCCNGAGIRFLFKFRNVAKMYGVDATEHVVELCRQRCISHGVEKQVDLILSDACESNLPSDSVDFVWGEDAWCYVSDKTKLISEAARIVKPGGVIAFTDWVEGTVEMSNEESERLLQFMKFPNVFSQDDYTNVLVENSCEVLTAEDTGRFSPYIDLYIDMLNKQLTYDALQIIGFDVPMLEQLGGEMEFMRGLAHQNKIAQGIFIARKK